MEKGVNAIAHVLPILPSHSLQVLPSHSHLRRGVRGVRGVGMEAGEVFGYTRHYLPPN